MPDIFRNPEWQKGLMPVITGLPLWHLPKDNPLLPFNRWYFYFVLWSRLISFFFPAAIALQFFLSATRHSSRLCLHTNSLHFSVDLLLFLTFSSFGQSSQWYRGLNFANLWLFQFTILVYLQDAGIGTSIDSFYEYLLKVSLYKFKV